MFAAALSILGFLAATAVIASELPRPVSVPVALSAVAYGFWLARSERRRPVHELVIATAMSPAEAAGVSVDGCAVDELQVQWRGPLAFLRWRDADGQLRRLQGWPDNLDAASRRELRLAMAARAPAHVPRSMAP